MKKLLTIFAVFTLILFLVNANEGISQIPQSISFQGKLMTLNGQPFNGTKNMTFTIGTWTKQMNVPVLNGLYSVELAVPDSVFNTPNVKLNIKVDGLDLSPDTEFQSVPYSYQSSNSFALNGHAGSHYLQTLSINGNELTISNGNTVTLPGGGGGSTQDLDLTDDTLKITDNNNATPIDLTVYIQDLDLTDDTLKITKNTNASLIDLSPYRQTLELNGGVLSISGGNNVNMSMAEEDPKVGALSENFVPKWGSNTKLENSLIYSEAANVGIGITSSLMARLHVEQNQGANAFRSYSNGGSGFAGEFANTGQANNDAALRVFTNGTGYAGHFSINYISSSAPALFASTIGTGSAGQFHANTSNAAVDVQNDNTAPTSIGLKSFSPGISIQGMTNSGVGVEGRATTTNGTGVFGYSEMSIGGLFQTGNTLGYALKSDGNFLTTTNARIDGNTGMGGNWDNGFRLYVYGSAYATGMWQSSDANLKTDIKPINSALNKVMQLRGVQYEWIDKNLFGTDRSVGFLAQELKEVFPELVKQTENGYAVQYGPLTAVLVEAVKEMNMQNESLKMENERLSEEIKELREMILQIQSQLK